MRNETVKSERESKIMDWRPLLKKFKRTVKDEYMLNLFESEDGSLETLKKANWAFDNVFLSIQMRLIMWIVSVAIGILLYYYFRFMGLSIWMTLSLSILLSYMIKKSLQLLGIALLTRAASKK